MGAGADAVNQGGNGASDRDVTYDGSGKSPDEIEEDIGDTRTELGQILDELQRKLAPQHLLERGMDMLKDSIAGDGRGISEAVWRHPVPLALIGVGVGWMAVAATTRRGPIGAPAEGVGGALHSAAGQLGEAAGQARERMAGMASPSTPSVAPGPYPTEAAGYAYARRKSGQAMATAREASAGTTAAARGVLRRTQEAGGAAWQRAGDYAGRAGDRLAETRDRLTEIIEENPLAVGALGFLAGSLLALLLPRSRIEAQLIGEKGDQIRARAAAGARRVAERTVDAAMGAVKDAVSDTADAVRKR
jgi:Protein of unknown function (DUF3618)